MKIQALPTSDEVEVRLIPENNWDAFIVKQLDCSTPSWRLDKDNGYLTATLRPVKD